MLRVQKIGKAFCVLAALVLVSPQLPIKLQAAESIAAAPDDATAKQRILDSPAWAEAMRKYDEWLSVQIKYDKSQVAELSRQLRERVAKMSAAETQGFLEDLREKLTLMLSPEAVDLRMWAAEYLDVLSDAKAAEFRLTFPDVAQMTAAQLRQALAAWDARRAQVRANRASFDRMRDQQVAALREMQRRDAEQMAAARSARRAPSRSTGGSFAPPAQRQPYVPRPPLSFGFGFRW